MRAEVAGPRPSSPPISEAPWTVKALVSVEVVAFISWVLLHVLDEGGDLAGPLLRSVIPILLSLGILKGYRAAWVIAAIFAALGVVGAIGFAMGMDDLRPADWSSLFFWAISLPLLFHPQTRGWARR